MLGKSPEFLRKRFEVDGFIGPIQVWSVEEAAVYYRRFFEVIGQDPNRAKSTAHRLTDWHHELSWAYKLASTRGMLECVSGLLGPDLVLWSMHFWYKEPHNTQNIPWHQDGFYWFMRPMRNITAWVALGPSKKENGCLRIIPGTHRNILQHKRVESAEGSFSAGLGLDATQVDETQAVDLEMAPGQVVFFNEMTVHGSKPNTSDTARVAFSLRFTTPDVKFLVDNWNEGGSIKTFLVLGEDRYRLNAGAEGKAPVDATETTRSVSVSRGGHGSRWQSSAVARAEKVRDSQSDRE